MDERHCKTCVCGCTCGFGGEHVEGNPRCALTAKSGNDVCEHQNANYLRMMSERDALRAEVERLRARIERVEALTEGLLTAEGWNDPEVETVLLIQRRYRAVLSGSGEQPGEGERAWLNADPRKAAENLRAVVGAGEQPGEDECEECEAVARMIYSDPSDLTGPCSRHPHDRPAPMVPDSADVRDLADRIETAMTDDGHRMPRTDETRYLAHVAAQTALAAVRPSGQEGS